MRTRLNFEDKDTKRLLAELDINFFLKQNFETQDYSQQDITVLNTSYGDNLKQLRSKHRKNRKQMNYYLEGQTRKMFTGGFLPALFHLDETRELNLLTFYEVGKDLAHFKLWQVYYKRKITAQKIWDVVIKTGSVLAIILSVIKLWEYKSLL